MEAAPGDDAVRDGPGDTAVRRTVLGNPAMVGASLVPTILIGLWGGAMLVARVTDPVAWGLVAFAFIFVCVATAIGAEISDAIRSRKS